MSGVDGLLGKIPLSEPFLGDLSKITEEEIAKIGLKKLPLTFN
jgi:glutamine synthetase